MSPPVRGIESSVSTASTPREPTTREVASSGDTMAPKPQLARTESSPAMINVTTR